MKTNKNKIYYIALVFLLVSPVLFYLIGGYKISGLVGGVFEVTFPLLQQLQDYSVILIGVSILLVILGLIYPKTVLWKKGAKRVEALKIYGTLFIVSICTVFFSGKIKVYAEKQARIDVITDLEELQPKLLNIDIDGLSLGMSLKDALNTLRLDETYFDNYPAYKSLKEVSLNSGRIESRDLTKPSLDLYFNEHEKLFSIKKQFYFDDKGTSFLGELESKYRQMALGPNIKRNMNKRLYSCWGGCAENMKGELIVGNYTSLVLSYEVARWSNENNQVVTVLMESPSLRPQLKTNQ